MIEIPLDLRLVSLLPQSRLARLSLPRPLRLLPLLQQQRRASGLPIDTAAPAPRMKRLPRHTRQLRRLAQGQQPSLQHREGLQPVSANHVDGCKLFTIDVNRPAFPPNRSIPPFAIEDIDKHIKKRAFSTRQPNTRVFSFRSEARSEEHTSELQSQSNLVCRLLLKQK